MESSVEELKIIQTILLLVTSTDVVQGKSLAKVAGEGGREGGREGGKKKGERGGRGEGKESRISGRKEGKGYIQGGRPSEMRGGVGSNYTSL